MKRFNFQMILAMVVASIFFAATCSFAGSADIRSGENIIDELSSAFEHGCDHDCQWWWEKSIGHNNHMFFTYAVDEDKDGKYANGTYGKWKMNIIDPGRYEVKVFIPSNYADSQKAKYKIQRRNEDGDTKDKEVTVNQSKYYNEWVTLGIYYFNTGDAYVKLKDDTGESYSKERRLAYDAVMMTSLDSPQPPTPDPSNSEPNYVSGSVNPASGYSWQNFTFRTEWYDAENDYIVDVKVRYRKTGSSTWKEVVLDYVGGGRQPQFSKSFPITGSAGTYEYQFQASDSNPADGPRKHTTDWQGGGTFAINGGSSSSGTRLDVPLYIQGHKGDQIWSRDRLGTCSTETIGSHGCAVSSIAMVFRYYGVSTDPRDMNNWLKANGGYSSGCLVNWPRAADHSGGKVQWVERVDYTSIPADLNKIKSEIDKGYPVIAEVRLSGYQHFVVITGYSGSTFYINDPWYGDKFTINKRYGSDPAKAIYGIRVYHGAVSQPQTLQTYLDLKIFDPACSGKDTCNGDYLQEKNGKVFVSSNINDLAGAKVFREGVITDGVTLLLLKAETNGKEPVTFTLLDAERYYGNGDIGQLMKRDASSSNPTSVTVTPEKVNVPGEGQRYIAFAVYQAPIDFPLSHLDSQGKITYKSISIRASSAGLSVEQPLKIYPPPVVMVHGVWSKPTDSWECKNNNCNDDSDKIENYLRKMNYPSYFFAFPNHGKDARDFDPDTAGVCKPNSTHPACIVANKIQEVLNTVRSSNNKSIAATQVDVVGHSMGGLVARARVALEDDSNAPFKKKGNYKKGDIHKIITVGTPHLGTPLANWLVNHKCDGFSGLAAGLGAGTFYISGGNGIIALGVFDLAKNLATVEDLFVTLGKPMGAAIYEFQTTSPERENIGKTMVRSHAIVGIEPEYSNTELLLNTILWASGNVTTIDKILGGDGQHDTIVPKNSQKGWIKENSTTEKTYILHADTSFTFFEITETEAPKVHDAVAKLLLTTPTDSDEFDNFGELHDGKSYPYPHKLYGEVCSTKRAARSKTLRDDQNVDTVKLEISSGLEVHPDDEVTIKFSIIDGNPIDGVNGVLIIVGENAQVIEGTGPYTLSFKVPREIGKLEIYAIAYGSDPKNYAAYGYLNVTPSAPPTAIVASPDSIVLEQIGDSYSISVDGVFQNDMLLSLNYDGSGTTYSTGSGTENVISVNSFGVVEAKGYGEDTVVITNSGISATVSVKVIDTSADEDTDGDGMPDAWENEHGFDPTIDDSSADADNDGLSNLDEYVIGSDPRKADTDEDGYSDLDEYMSETDPTNPESYPIDPLYKAGVFTVDSTGIVKVDWLYDGGKYQGEFGIFNLDSMGNLTPGSPEFIAEAARRVLSNSEMGYLIFSDLQEGARFSGILGNEIRDWNSGAYKGIKSFAMPPGTQFATILVPNSTFESLLQNPPTSDTNKRPLFSLVSDNPAYGMYTGQMADINGMGMAFAYEDKDAASSDWDFNDLIVMITGAENYLPSLDSLVGTSETRSKREKRDNAFTDWRVNSELGQMIMAHVEASLVTEDSLRMTITLKAPATLLVYDPKENLIGKDGGEIAGASFERSADGTQTVTLPKLNVGDYRVVLQTATAVQGVMTVKTYQGSAELSSNDISISLTSRQTMAIIMHSRSGQPLTIATPVNATSYDFNGDSVVDNADVSMIVRHWNSCRNQQKYDPFYDLDEDGCITVADVMKVLNAKTVK